MCISCQELAKKRGTFLNGCEFVLFPEVKFDCKVFLCIVLALRLETKSQVTISKALLIFCLFCLLTG